MDSASDDDGFEIIGETGCEVASLPHLRTDCLVHPFSKATALAHCGMCYCYVCDRPAAECATWQHHCCATHKGPEQKKWRDMKEAAKNGGVPRVKKMKAITSYFSKAPAVVNSSSSSSSGSSSSSSSSSSSYVGGDSSSSSSGNNLDPSINITLEPIAEQPSHGDDAVVLATVTAPPPSLATLPKWFVAFPWAEIENVPPAPSAKTMFHVAHCVLCAVRGAGVWARPKLRDCSAKAAFQSHEKSLLHANALALVGNVEAAREIARNRRVEADSAASGSDEVTGRKRAWE